MKILLIKPPSLNFKGVLKKQLPPLALGYLAAVLEQNNYNIELFDATLEDYDSEFPFNDFLIQYGSDDNKIRERIRSVKPDIVGIHLTMSIYNKCALNVAKLVKEVDSNIKVIVGGVHATYTYTDLIKSPHIDYIVLGEGERTIINLLKGLEAEPIETVKGIAYKRRGKVIATDPAGFIADLDSIPLPAYHLLDMEEYFRINLPHNHFAKGKRVGSILSSRGCGARCIFCSSSSFFGHKVRMRSPENVKKEIEYLIDNYNIDEVQFIDDDLTCDKKRAANIFDIVGEYGLPWCTPNGIRVHHVNEELLENMKKNGCYRTTYAIESGNQRIVKDIANKNIKLDYAKDMIKKTKGIGIEVHCFFMIGLPGETMENIQETFDFAKECEPDSVSISIAMPLPGTALYEVCKENNYLANNFEFDMSFEKIGNINTPEFRGENLEGISKIKNRELNEYLSERSSSSKYDRFAEQRNINKVELFDKI